MKGWRSEKFAAGAAFVEIETGGEVLLKESEPQDGLSEFTRANAPLAGGIAFHDPAKAGFAGRGEEFDDGLIRRITKDSCFATATDEQE